jgi:hypothetical protein
MTQWQSIFVIETEWHYKFLPRGKIQWIIEHDQHYKFIWKDNIWITTKHYVPYVFPFENVFPQLALSQ